MSRYKYRLSMDEAIVGDFTSINHLLDYLICNRNIADEEVRQISAFFKLKRFEIRKLKTYISQSMKIKIETIQVVFNGLIRE